MLALVAAASLWGTSFLFGKVALREIGPADLTLLRFALATLALLPVALARRVYPRRRDLPLFALTGVLTVPTTFLVQFAGLQRTSASVAALIVGSNAPLIAVAARLFLGERLGRPGWIAVGLSSLGVALTVCQPGAGNDWTGDALVFLSMLTVVGWVLLGRRLMRAYAPVAATAYIIAFGTLATLPLALLLEGPPRVALSAGAWASVAMLGLGCSAASLALWNWGQSGVPAGRASIYLNLEPLVDALLGVLILGQGLSPPRHPGRGAHHRGGRAGVLPTGIGLRHGSTHARHGLTVWVSDKRNTVKLVRTMPKTRIIHEERAMLTTLIAFAGAALLLAMAPGPSTALVLRQTLRGGRRLAFVTTLGNATGLLTWSVAAAFGLSALVAASRIAYDAIKIAGAVVLVALGVQSLLRAHRDKVADTVGIVVEEAVPPSGGPRWAAFRIGLVTNLANPKAAVFAVSFLPQFVPPHAPVLATILLLTVIRVIVSVCWYTVVAWLVNRARMTFSRHGVRRRLEQVSGILLVSFGLRLAIEHR